MLHTNRIILHTKQAIAHVDEAHDWKWGKKKLRTAYSIKAKDVKLEHGRKKEDARQQQVSPAAD